MRVFIDASALLALADPGNDGHHAAVQSLRRLDPPPALITTDFALAQALSGMHARHGRPAAELLQRSISASRALRVAHVDPDLFRAAWNLYASPDCAALDFGDCTSLAAVRALGLRHAMTFSASPWVEAVAGLRRLPATAAGAHR